MISLVCYAALQCQIFHSDISAIRLTGWKRRKAFARKEGKHLRKLANLENERERNYKKLTALLENEIKTTTPPITTYPAPKSNSFLHNILKLLPAALSAAFGTSTTVIPTPKMEFYSEDGFLLRRWNPTPKMDLPVEGAPQVSTSGTVTRNMDLPGDHHELAAPKEKSINTDIIIGNKELCTCLMKSKGSKELCPCPEGHISPFPLHKKGYKSFPPKKPGKDSKENTLVPNFP